MFKKLGFSILSFALVFSLSACGGGSSDSGGEAPAPAPGGVTKVVAISDSLGTGFGIATPWPGRLATAINAEVINDSADGRQTGVGVGQITGLINRESPSHVVILLGTNDAIRGSVQGAINNLQQMVNIARDRDVIAIVATLPPITRSGTENSRADQISRGIRNLSGAEIADVRAAFGNDRSLIADGVHPNNTGQQLIADRIARLF